MTTAINLETLCLVALRGRFGSLTNAALLLFG